MIYKYEIPELGVVQSDVSSLQSSFDSIQDSISRLEKATRWIERVQKKKCWQGAFRCGKRGKE